MVSGKIFLKWDYGFLIMHASAIKGVSFGLTSGIITTLGMIVGLDSGTHSRAVVIGGVLTIAIADAFSDALGMHISEESSKKNGPEEVWFSTIATFLSKLLFALSFLVPMMLMELDLAIVVSVVWGISVLAAISVWMAVDDNKKPLGVVLEHLMIAVVVIIITHFVGDFIGRNFAG
jgi:VIT1/CCC1 family predicted Fe2+/Mn2+ transporter